MLYILDRHHLLQKGERFQFQKKQWSPGTREKQQWSPKPMEKRKGQGSNIGIMYLPNPN